MRESTKGSIKMRGVKLIDGAYKYEDINFAAQNDGDVCGFGLPISLEAGKKMIEGFQAGLIEELEKATKDRKNNNPGGDVNEESPTEITLKQHPIAITLGKEALLYIMSQKDCEGIRFYFCKNHRTELSIVACGVKTNSTVGNKVWISTSLASTAKDLGAPEGKLSIVDSEVSSDQPGISPDRPGIISDQHVEGCFLFEVGPPTRLKDVLDNPVTGSKINNNPFEEELRFKFERMIASPVPLPALPIPTVPIPTPKIREVQ